MAPDDGLLLGAASELIRLNPLSGDHHCLQSSVAPQEPQEFSAMLRLSAGGSAEEVPFAMAEPEGHNHDHRH